MYPGCNDAKISNISLSSSAGRMGLVAGVDADMREE
jgi:hypothetical protein